MILWLKYNGHPFDTWIACRNTKFWSDVQPGGYDLWKIGNNSKWIITLDDDPKHCDIEYFVIPKSREELKIWLDINHMNIAKRIGFSECIYKIDEEMVPNFWNHLWVGYELIHMS